MVVLAIICSESSQSNRSKIRLIDVYPEDIISLREDNDQYQRRLMQFTQSYWPVTYMYRDKSTGMNLKNIYNKMTDFKVAC